MIRAIRRGIDRMLARLAQSLALSSAGIHDLRSQLPQNRQFDQLARSLQSSSHPADRRRDE
jgi:hypothetical protein